MRCPVHSPAAASTNAAIACRVACAATHLVRTRTAPARACPYPACCARLRGSRPALTHCVRTTCCFLASLVPPRATRPLLYLLFVSDAASSPVVPKGRPSASRLLHPRQLPTADARQQRGAAPTEASTKQHPQRMRAVRAFVLCQRAHYYCHLYVQEKCRGLCLPGAGAILQVATFCLGCVCVRPSLTLPFPLLAPPLQLRRGLRLPRLPPVS